MLARIDHHYVARLIGLGRIGLGLAMVLAPRRLGRVWVGAAADLGEGRMVTRIAGARDIALGYGTIKALDAGDPATRDWVTVAGACDVVDAAATLMAYPSLPKRRRGVALLAAVGAASASFIGRQHIR